MNAHAFQAGAPGAQAGFLDGADHALIAVAAPLAALVDKPDVARCSRPQARGPLRIVESRARGAIVQVGGQGQRLLQQHAAQRPLADALLRQQFQHCGRLLPHAGVLDQLVAVLKSGIGRIGRRDMRKAVPDREKRLLVRAALVEKHFRVVGRPAFSESPRQRVMIHDEIPVLEIEPADVELPQHPAQRLIEPVLEGRVPDAGAVFPVEFIRLAFFVEHARIRMFREEIIEVILVVPFIVGAAIPGGAESGHDRHALLCRVVGHALGVFRAAVRIAKEAPDDNTPDSQAGGAICQPAIILDERPGMLEIPVVTPAGLKPGIVQRPVGAVIPCPEIGSGQGRFRTIKIPRIIVARHGAFIQRAFPDHVFSMAYSPPAQQPVSARILRIQGCVPRSQASRCSSGNRSIA